MESSSKKSLQNDHFLLQQNVFYILVLQNYKQKLHTIFLSIHYIEKSAQGIPLLASTFSAGLEIQL